MAARTGRLHQPHALVLTERLRVHLQQAGRDADYVNARELDAGGVGLDVSPINNQRLYPSNQTVSGSARRSSTRVNYMVDIVVVDTVRVNVNNKYLYEFRYSAIIFRGFHRNLTKSIHNRVHWAG